MDLWQQLQAERRPIVLYGTGNGADRILDRLESLDISPVGIFASDEFVRGQQFRGFTVQKYSTLAELYPDMVILVSFGSGRAEVRSQIRALGERHTVLCPDVPVYGDTVFDGDFYAEHQSEIDEVYAHLADDDSRRTYQNIIRFKLTGDSEYLHQIEQRRNRFDFLQGENELLLDLGAFRGDTAAEFLAQVPNGRVLAIEPNLHNYNKLCRFAEDYPAVTPRHAAVSDYVGECLIAGDGRGGGIRQKGTLTPVVTVDSLDICPTCIKMDVEGEEAAVLRGAAQTVARCKPALVVAAYHRSEDIFSLPLAVLAMRPDYRIAVRHAPHNLAWDTDFIFF